MQNLTTIEKSFEGKKFKSKFFFPKCLKKLEGAISNQNIGLKPTF